MRKIDTFAERGDGAAGETHIEARDFSLFYGDFEAVRKVSLEIPKRKVTAMIGPSGC
ncbi:MAG: phosphate ABC transporter ATP-binding protein, partial [Verrucomicrobiota bacterium]|nr:phosphate ABC transporter ATP-binding protein [Verrucomicrobiota bacterium]